LVRECILIIWKHVALYIIWINNNALDLKWWTFYVSMQKRKEKISEIPCIILWVLVRYFNGRELFEEVHIY